MLPRFTRSLPKLEEDSPAHTEKGVGEVATDGLVALRFQTHTENLAEVSSNAAAIANGEIGFGDRIKRDANKFSRI